MLIDYPWYAVLLCLLAGALYAGVLYFVGRRSFGGWQLWLLSALRFLAVSAIAFLLCAPMARQSVHERQKPQVVLVDDCSQSVQLSADSAFSLMSLWDDLGRNCALAFNADASNPMRTDIGQMLEVPGNTTAIVLATDGIYNHGANPVTVAERLGIPVYTVALGDTTPRCDATLADIRCNRIAMLGNNFPVELTVNASLLKGRSATLSISDAAGHRLFSQSVAYTDDDFSAAVSASLPAGNAGLQRYTVALEVVDGETITDNNRLTFFVDVIDARRKVAIFANAPHPDLAALKRSIESNPNYEATVIMAEDISKGKVKIDADDYSMAVMHNLPSRTHTDIRYADALPKLFIIGLQTDLSRFNALHCGLEIVSKASGKNNEVTALHQKGFTLFHLTDNDAEAIEAMPPLAAPFGEGRMAEGVQVLFSARLGNIDSRQPLLAATTQGELRRTFVWGEGLWRWRLMDYQTSGSHEHFDRLLSQLVAFTAMQQRRDRLQVLAERSYAAGETPMLRAQLYNEAYELTNTPEVKLTLTGDSMRAEYTFVREGQAYRLALPDLREGLYRYTASTADGLSADGSFAVEAINLETRRLTADHNLLRTLGAATGGRMFYPGQVDELVKELSSIKPVIYTHTRYADFLRLPIVLALIVLLLAAEWVLRKYHGEL